ncbi:MAG: acetylglutamate kinase [Lachnospiraceae bacterium]|jgi:acetylglutamate kinase
MGNLETYQEKADVLIEALPYIQRFNRKIIVVKYGGSAMENPELQKSVIEDVVLLKLVGFKPIIVHGGGKEISRWIKKVGMQPEFVNGLRVTDEATMEIAEMVLNKVNKNLVRMIEELGVHAVGISGKDGGLLKAKKKYSEGRDIGYVGDVETVDTGILQDLLDDDFLPVVCPVGMDEHYNTFNINADDAACAIAKAIKADKLVFLSDVWGVCRNPEDAHSLISELTISEAKDMIADGTISGGMLPKIESCIDAIDNGVNRVHILNGKIPRCLLLEIFSNKGIGTAVMNDHERRYYHEDQ